MSDLFYRAFEEKFRGSRSLISSRLDIYRAFISPLKQIYADAQGLDLGCGRGEWLEILQEEGIQPQGVDMDEGMLEACRTLNLPAIKGDAVAYLAALPSESQTVISAFHMVEHIPFDRLQVVVAEALRVLKPGGLLVMETPNPENIQVGTHTFYYDPTHQRPIPPLLLAFLPEHYGFGRTKILRLQQDSRLENKTAPDLMDVLTGASPDYAVIAQKAAIPSLLGAFDEAFETEYGLTLPSLASRYDASRSSQIDIAFQRAQQATALANNAASVAQQAMVATQQTRELIADFEAKLLQFQNLTAVSEQRVNALLSSTSWRITAPARKIARFFKQIPAIRKFATIAKNPVAHGTLFIQRRPTLRTIVIAFIPGFESDATASHSTPRQAEAEGKSEALTVQTARFIRKTGFSYPSAEEILERIKGEIEVNHQIR